MNMQNEGGARFELPSQVPETSQEQSSEKVQERAVEQQSPAKQEAGVGKRAPQPGSTAVTDVAIPQIPTIPAVQTDDKPASAKSVPPSTNDLPADDADLIEKEWVERAKTIVAKTQDDPHLQKSEMSKIKADYIKKRFNKTIKTDETAVA